MRVQDNGRIGSSERAREQKKDVRHGERGRGGGASIEQGGDGGSLTGKKAATCSILVILECGRYLVT